MSNHQMTPRLSSIRTETRTYADNPSMLRISYSKAGSPGDDPNIQKYGATITIDPTGGTASELLITLTELRKDGAGDALSNVTHAIHGNTYDTLAEVVAAINAIGPFTAWVTDAPFSHDTGSASFTALSATRIPEAPFYLDCLKRDVQTSNPVYIRLGEPTERDNGYQRLFGVNTSITSATGAVITVGRDDGVSDYEVLDTASAASTTAPTEYFSKDELTAPTYQGALLITYSASNLTGASVTVRTQTANC